MPYKRSICSTTGAVLPHGASSMVGRSFFVKRHSLFKKLKEAGTLG